MLSSRFMICKGFVFAMALTTHAVCLVFDFSLALYMIKSLENEPFSLLCLFFRQP